MSALVHLVWAPLGLAPLRRFLAAYDEREAGCEHELVVLLNGLGLEGAVAREVLLAELRSRPHRVIELRTPVQDLDAYAHAARELEAHDALCFVNSYAVPVSDGWLSLLLGALGRPGVGLAGASGNWESLAAWRRGPVQHWPLQILGAARARRDYPRFPNPHVRTSSWAISRRTLLALGLPPAVDKQAAYRLESGIHSVTRRVQEQELRTVVVGRDGHLYDPPEWPLSRTFRSSKQENLLVADNQTAAYLDSPARVRRRLRRDSWGRADPG